MKKVGLLSSVIFSVTLFVIHVVTAEKRVPLELSGSPDYKILWKPLWEYSPKNLAPVGRDNVDGSVPLRLVRITLADGSIVPGMISTKDKDVIIYGYHGQESGLNKVNFKARNASIFWAPPGAISWVHSNEHVSHVPKKWKIPVGKIRLPDGALRTVYSCRAFFQNNARRIKTGYWYKKQKGCWIPHGGKEVLLPHFEIMVLNEYGVLRNSLDLSKTDDSS